MFRGLTERLINVIVGVNCGQSVFLVTPSALQSGGMHARECRLIWFLPVLEFSNFDRLTVLKPPVSLWVSLAALTVMLAFPHQASWQRLATPDAHQAAELTDKRRMEKCDARFHAQKNNFQCCIVWLVRLRLCHAAQAEFETNHHLEHLALREDLKGFVRLSRAQRERVGVEARDIGAFDTAHQELATRDTTYDAGRRATHDARLPA